MRTKKIHIDGPNSAMALPFLFRLKLCILPPDLSEIDAEPPDYLIPVYCTCDTGILELGWGRQLELKR